MQASDYHRWRLVVVAAIGSLALGAGVASGAPGDPKKQLVPGDQTYARSVLVRTSDLPARAWQVRPTPFGQPNPPCVVQHYSLSALTWTGLAGRTFTSGSTLAEADVEVFSTTAQTRRAYALLFEPGLVRCLAGVLAAQIGKSAAGVTVRVVRITRFAPALTEPAHGFRIAFEVRSSQGTGSVDVVGVGILDGRALGLLSLVGIPSAWPQSSVQTVAATMSARLRSHRLPS